MISAKLLQGLNWTAPAEWAAALEGPCRRFEINTSKRLAMFLANTGHETAGGRRLRESLNYRPEALVKQWPRYFTLEYAAEVGRTVSRPADEKAIAEAAYGGRMGNKNPGDGWRFIGRGLMQTTGRYNYERLAEIVNRPIDGLPEWIETREGAVESAAIFWHSKNCNDVADAGAVDRCRHRINGGLIGIDDVRSRYATALGLLT
jgi:putative chitinase